MSFGLVAATVMAVLKVTVAVFVGAYTCKKVPYISSTVRDFSFLIAAVLLPCLALYNVSMSVTTDMLINCCLLLFLSFIFIGIGVLCASLFAKTMLAVPDDKRGVPPELLNDVRLELMCTDDVVVRGDQPEHKGTYYVCVVLGERLESLGLTGSDVVPQLTVPGVEVERFPQYFWGSIVALSILNTIILPLSVFQNLVEWVDWVDLEEGTAYIFVFSMATTVYLWGIGPLLVKHSKSQQRKKKQIRTLMERHQQCLRQYDVATQTEVVEESSPTRIVTDFAVPREEPEVEERGEEVMSTNDKGAQLAPASVGLDLHPLTPTPATVERFPYNWEKEGALRVVYASQMKEYDARVRRTMAQRVRKGAKKLYRSLSTNLPFLSIVVAIVIGIVPFLRSIFIGGPLEMFMDTVGVLSGGTIPCCLLLLGAKLVGPTANKEDEEEDDTPAPSRNVEQNTTLPLFKEDLQLVGDDASFADEYNMALDEVVVDEFDFNASFVTGDHHLDVVVEAEEGEDKRKPSFLDSIFDLGEANKTFVWGLIVAKLVIIPAVTFVFLILVSKVLLAVGGDTFKSKTLFYVLFSQMTAPTGIKTQLLYNQADFMVAEWSKMLSLQHLLGVVSTLIWTCLSLFYVRGMY